MTAESGEASLPDFPKQVRDAPRRGFITGGCWVVDRDKTIPFWPEEDMSIPVSAPVQRGGGSACNFAVDIRKLDPTMPVETIGLVGDDADGRFLTELAASHGIGVDQLQITSEAPTHATDAFQSLKSGRRTHLFHGGASDPLAPTISTSATPTAAFSILAYPACARRWTRRGARRRTAGWPS